MREAVEDPLARRQARHGAAVVLLVEEEARLLAVLEVDVVTHAVLADDAAGRRGRLRPGAGGAPGRAVGSIPGRTAGRALERIPALIERKALLLANLGIVALVDAGDVLAVLAQDAREQREQHGAEALHAHGEAFGHQDVLVAVDHQAREGVGLAEDKAAAVGVGHASHDRLAILPRPTDFALPKRLVKAVVRVARHDADADLALQRDGTGPQIGALLVDDVDQIAVFDLAPVGRGRSDLEHLGVVDPHVAGGQEAGALLRDDRLGEGTQLLHGEAFRRGGAGCKRWTGRGARREGGGTAGEGKQQGGDVGGER